MFRRLVELVVLRLRSERSKELEILVLRHQLHVLQRQVARPRPRPADRVLLAAFSRSLPRSAWSTLFVSPAGQFNDNQVPGQPQTQPNSLYPGNLSYFYNYYGIERLGRLSGQRFLGRIDWYREGCERLVGFGKYAGMQELDGSFDTRPSADLVLQEGDVIVGVGRPEEIRALEELFEPREAVAG